MNLLITLRGSMMEGFLPSGWDLEKIDRLADLSRADMVKRRPWWNPQFEPMACASLADFDTYMGHEIAREIVLSKQAGRPLILILPSLHRGERIRGTASLRWPGDVLGVHHRTAGLAFCTRDQGTAVAGVDSSQAEARRRRVGYWTFRLLSLSASAPPREPNCIRRPTAPPAPASKTIAPPASACRCSESTSRVRAAASSAATGLAIACRGRRRHPRRR